MSRLFKMAATFPAAGFSVKWKLSCVSSYVSLNDELENCRALTPSIIAAAGGHSSVTGLVQLVIFTCASECDYRVFGV